MFRLGAEWFALPTIAVDEVAELRGIHSLPHRRGGMLLGLVNVQGELIVCVSLARVLGLKNVVASTAGEDGPRRARLLVVSVKFLFDLTDGKSWPLAFRPACQLRPERRSVFRGRAGRRQGRSA